MSAIEKTIRSFKSEQFTKNSELLSAIVFACSATEIATSTKADSAESLAAFIASPFLASLSDRYPRKRMLLLSLAGMGLSRSLSLFFWKYGSEPFIPEFTNSALLGSLILIAKARLGDFSQNSVQTADSGIRLALAGACGALISPIIKGSLERMSGSPLGCRLFSVAAAVGCFGAVLALADESKECEIDRGTSEDSMLIYTPLCFSKLLTSKPDAFKALMISFLVEYSTGVTFFEAAEQAVKELSSTASSKLRFALLLGGSSLIGLLVARELQKRIGLKEQARVSSAVHVLAAVLLYLKRPYLALLISILGKRGQDATDVFLFENRGDGGGRGESAASLANWRSIASFCGILATGFLKNTYSNEIVYASLALSAVSAELVRESMKSTKYFMVE